ncbi:TIGR02530 family flagellar biosynthesis protein [Alkaliphilus crotonatoxidans]
MYQPINIKINPLQQQSQRTQAKQNYQSHSNISFDQLLKQQINQSQTLKFSKHAMERLEKRNIQLTPQDLARLNQGLEMASRKGIKETLIMMDNRIFVASVNNKTVITAALEEQLKDNVFTNIDGAVIV